MRGPRARVPQRRRIFLGCEGESERSYGALLGRLIELRHHRIHIDAVLLQPGAGDPLAIVERAVSQMSRRAGRGDNYVARAVLLDSDTCGRVPDRDARAITLARENGVRLIWQVPCHEAILLRHFEGCESLRPTSSGRAAAELQRRWPEYRKGLPASRLAACLNEAAVLRAASVEHELGAFLADISFAQD